MTPYTEGRLAGYRNAPMSSNPYLKGLTATAEQLAWATQWRLGYVEGAHQANDDLIARRLEACR